MASTLYPDEIVIDDGTHQTEISKLKVQARGLELGLRGPNTYAYGAAATPFPANLLIPSHEWQARIQEMEEQKTRVSDLINAAGLPCKNQQQTNYCWINAPTHLVEITRVLQNQKMVILSAASAGAQIKNYQNVGGWGLEGLQFIIEKGLVPESAWPANKIDPRYATQENLKLAMDYRGVRWWELQPRTLEEQMSCLLRRIPFAAGLNWWGHEIVLVDPVWINGQPGGRMRNSWGMDWPSPGAGGYAILQGDKFLSDDTVALESVLAT